MNDQAEIKTNDTAEIDNQFLDSLVKERLDNLTPCPKPVNPNNDLVLNYLQNSDGTYGWAVRIVPKLSQPFGDLVIVFNDDVTGQGTVTRVAIPLDKIPLRELLAPKSQCN